MNTVPRLDRTLRAIERSGKIIQGYEIPEKFKATTTTKHMEEILYSVGKMADAEPKVLEITVFGLIASVEVDDETIMFSLRRGKAKSNIVPEGIVSTVGKYEYRTRVISDDELYIATDRGTVKIVYKTLCEFDDVKLIESEGMYHAIDMGGNLIYVGKEMVNSLTDSCIEQRKQKTLKELTGVNTSEIEGYLSDISFMYLETTLLSLLEEKGSGIPVLEKNIPSDLSKYFKDIRGMRYGNIEIYEFLISDISRTNVVISSAYSKDSELVTVQSILGSLNIQTTKVNHRTLKAQLAQKLPIKEHLSVCILTDGRVILHDEKRDIIYKGDGMSTEPRDRTTGTLFEDFMKEDEIDNVMKRTVNLLEKESHFIKEISQNAIKHVSQGFTFHTFVDITEPSASLNQSNVSRNRLFAQTDPIVQTDSHDLSDCEMYLLLNTGGVASVFNELADTGDVHNVRYYEGILSIHVRLENGQELMTYMIPSENTPTLETSNSLSIVYEESGTVTDLKALFRLCKK